MYLFFQLNDSEKLRWPIMADKQKNEHTRTFKTTGIAYINCFMIIFKTL